jgi:hypothetical protein
VASIVLDCFEDLASLLCFRPKTPELVVELLSGNLRDLVDFRLQGVVDDGRNEQ